MSNQITPNPSVPSQVVQEVKFPKFVNNLGIIPTSYKDSMSYYECLAWLCKYLEETVIPTVNENGEAVEELQGLYIELNSYVTHYFDNLDVQEEINNKLDEMATTGVLQNVLHVYFTDLENQLSLSIESINSRVNAISSGSPAGVYSTVSALTTADPDHSKIYLVTADGKWYYYDTSNSQWAAGGTYQATGVGEEDVSNYNLTKGVQHTLYDTLTADDIIWVKGFGYYQGGLTSQTNILSSQLFNYAKGTPVSISTDFKARISYYDLSKNYVGDTGAYKTFATDWVMPIDGYVSISIVNGTDDTLTTRDDGSSSNVTIKALRKKEYNQLSKNISFTVVSTNFLLSNPIYVGKGTKITLTSVGASAGGTLKDPFYYIGVREANESKAITSYVNYSKTPFTISKDCFVQLFIRFRNSSGIIAPDDYMKTRILNSIDIDYVHYNKLINQPFAYISSNGTIDIIQGYSSGKSLVKLNNTINIINYSSLIGTFSQSDILTDLESAGVTYNGETYIEIPTYSELRYNVTTAKFEIVSVNATNLKLDENISLLKNGYGNIVSGILLDIFEKNQVYNFYNNKIDIFNSSPIEPTYNWQTKAIEYCDELNESSDNSEKFLFFTDQHLMGTNNTFDKARLEIYINTLQKMYNSLPLSYIVSGGDWLNSGDTQEYACFKLGYVDGFMNSMFKNYFPILGNHDTNYQGKLDDESEANTGELSNSTIINLFFNKYKKAYYSFDGINSKNYVLDTQTDWDSTMDTYKWDQIEWLANKLIEDDPTHATLLLHIIWLNSNHDVVALADNATKLIYAFNQHTTITLNSETYDFTGCTGHVDYALSGHTHFDYNDTINNVLCVATLNFTNGGTPSYDLIINDYDNNKLKMIRVGTGSNREFSI